jgi:methionyl-tRNA formyltransferase
MGTPEFAVTALDLLLKNKFEVVAVVTAPDRPAGRGLQMTSSAVKNYALKKDLPVLQPERLKDENFLGSLRSLNADLQLVVAFRMLPEVVWNMPRLGTYNLHASLLPRYRGAAPINWAIINGEKVTGVTTFKLRHEIDTGNILLNREVKIGENMTAGELHDRLAETGAHLLAQTVSMITRADKEGTPLSYISQEESLVTHAPKIFKEHCLISWSMHAAKIHDLIRGLSPYPGAFTYTEHKAQRLSLKIFRSRFEKLDHEMKAGSLITDGKEFVKVYAPGGMITLEEIQLEGKRRMHITEFLRGFRFQEDSMLG